MERCALVTGGSSGIGLAVARMLCAEGYGVTIAGRHADRLSQAAGTLPPNVHCVVADIAREQDVSAMVRGHTERFGRLDILVNSAGLFGSDTASSAVTAEVDARLAVNLRGPLLVTREALPLLRAAGAEHGKALVVNLSSVSGLHGQPRSASYSATKAGLISLTQSLQRETAADGIQATAICPGLVATAMTAGSAVLAEEMVQPEDVAETVRFLIRTSRWCLVPEVVLNRRGAIS